MIAVTMHGDGDVSDDQHHEQDGGHHHGECDVELSVLHCLICLWFDVTVALVSLDRLLALLTEDALAAGNVLHSRLLHVAIELCFRDQLRGPRLFDMV
jgi:hypothetical protein